MAPCVHRAEDQLAGGQWSEIAPRRSTSPGFPPCQPSLPCLRSCHLQKQQGDTTGEKTAHARLKMRSRLLFNCPAIQERCLKCAVSGFLNSPSPSPAPTPTPPPRAKGRISVFVRILCRRPTPSLQPPAVKATDPTVGEHVLSTLSFSWELQGTQRFQTHPLSVHYPALLPWGKGASLHPHRSQRAHWPLRALCASASQCVPLLAPGPFPLHFFARFWWPKSNCPDFQGRQRVRE